jgi:hypothetical protein
MRYGFTDFTFVGAATFLRLRPRRTRRFRLGFTVAIPGIVPRAEQRDVRRKVLTTKKRA